MWFQNRIKSILKALLIACVVLVSPAFATDYNIYYDNNASVLNGATVTVTYSGAVQYYVDGSTLYYKTDVNASSWAFGSDMYLNSLSTTSTDFVFVGWCAFNSQADAVANNYTCDNPVGAISSSGWGTTVLNVSDGGDWYLYAKWAPIYNINYYDDSGQAINVSNTPLQYCVTGNSFRTREDLNNDYWGWDNGRLGELEKSGFAFAGWCAFASQADAVADNYTCDDPVDDLRMDDSRWSLNVSNGGDWYLYAKWAPIYNINYYDDSGQAINVSNTPLQYWVRGDSVRTREDLNNDYWGWSNPLGELEKSGFVFAGWCAFASQADAAADNYTCDDPVVELGMDDSRWRLNVSNKGDLYLYAKWVTPTPVYNIYYDNMGADRDDGSAERPGQYNVVASNVRTRIDSNADWRWFDDVTRGLGPEKSDFVFRGWCAFDSAEAAAAADYNCQQPIEFLYTGSNCTNCLNVSDKTDLYLYAKWGGANSVNCWAGQYAYYDGSDLQCQYGCPANFYCDGLNSNDGSDLTAEDNGMHSCASYDVNKPYSSSYSTSSSACSACPEVDFSGITAPSGYQIQDFDALSKDLNGNGVNQAGECVAPVLLYNDMVLICSGYVPGTCDPSSMNAGLMSCRYDSSTGGYTNCSSMAGVCGAAELMSLMSIAQSGAEGVLNTELSRKGLSQNNINWNTFFGSNNIANWDSSSSIVTDRTYCSTASVQCSAGEAARFIVDSNNTLLTPSCVPCPNGFYCSNSDTYTFSDSVFVEHDASNNYDIYMAGMTACTGGVATTATGATDASFCMSGASPCVPDRDNNGAIISSRVPGGNILSNSDISGATKTPELVTFLNSNNEPYQACASVYLSALDGTALANSQLAEPTATLSEAGLRTVVCKYNTASGKYDLCSPAFTVCDSMYLGMLQLYNTPSQLASALAPAFSKGQSSYITDSKLSRVFNIDTIESENTCSCDTGFEWSESGNTCCPDGYACCLAGTQYNLISGECEQCSGANCPNTYNKSYASCPDASDFSALANPSVPGMVQFGYRLEGSYGTTADECVAMRVYYNDATDLFTQYGNAYYPSQDINDWVDAGASIAFCKYNTGNSETNLCTPKYSLCPEDDVMALMGAGDAVGIMQAVLGISDPSTIDSNFTETPSSLASANVTNRCQASCPSGSICCLAGQYINPDTTKHGTAEECLSCDAGFYCPTGDEYDTSTNFASFVSNKTACSSGYYSTGGAESCTQAQAGYYVNADASGQTQCPTGTYNELPGQTACTNCPAGTYNDLTGQDSAKDACQSCASGYYSVAGSESCTQAQAGYYVNNDASGQTACAAGTYNSLPGQTSSAACLDCSAGTYSASGASSCITCSGDTYNTSSGSATCQACGAGSYANGSHTGCDCLKGLPSGYTQLEYIQSAGPLNHIDTGYTPAADKTRIVTKVDFLGTGDNKLFNSGVYETDLYQLQRFSSVHNNQIGVYWFSNSGSRDYATSTSYTENNNPVEIDFNKNVLNINGTEVNVFPTKNYTSSTSLKIFYNGDDSDTNLHYFKIYDNDTLVRDFVPAKDSNGVVGLYDMVNGQFYTSVENKTFGAGPVRDARYHWDSSTNTCLACDAGYEWDASTSTCVTKTYSCLSGKYLTYDSVSQDYVCTDCPAGSYCEGGNNLTVLNTGLTGTCSANYFSIGGTSSCSACPAGATSTANSSSCVCPEYYEWNSTSHTCVGVDVTINWGNTTNTCTYGGTFTAPSTAPTAPEGYKFIGWRVVNIVPDGYTRLEYIQGWGGQYVNTGVNGQANSTIEVDYQITYSGTDNNATQTVYSSTEQWGGGQRLGYAENVSRSPTQAYLRYDKYATLDNIADRDRHKIRQEGNNFYKDNTLIGTISESANIIPTPIWLMSNFDYQGYRRNGMTGRVYSAKIWGNGTDLSFDGIPAKRNSDNVVGMYDTVSKQFFPVQ